LSGLQAAGHRPALLAGIVVGERRQNGVINLNDGKRAASSPDWLSGSDPLLTAGNPNWLPDSRHSSGQRDGAAMHVGFGACQLSLALKSLAAVQLK
jgi:hypothetical protein